MSIEQILNHFNKIQLGDIAPQELVQMDKPDLELVLSITLPSGTDIAKSVEEVMKWQQANLDIMKK